MNTIAMFTGHLDPVKETARIINTIPLAVRTKADNYCEGGHWLLLWNFLNSAIIAWLFLFGGLSYHIQKWLTNIRRNVWRNTAYISIYYLAAFLLSIPLDIYQNFFREKQYGQSNQSFVQWFSSDLMSFLIVMILMTIFFLLVYLVLRKTKERWWIWGAGISIVFITGFLIIYPIFITPIFNNYSKLRSGSLNTRILSLARANQVDIREVYVYDGSQQTTQTDASVSGLGSTTRITVNDNTLKKFNDNEILAIMGHEMGHYVLHHLFLLVLEFGALVVLGFKLGQWSLTKLIDRYGDRWNIRTIADVSSLPLLIFFFTLYFFLLTPLSNSIIRNVEQEADNYGLNAARDPDAFIAVLLKTADSNKIAPGYWEELFFFDHPARRERILAGETWKAENPKP